jgi:hypothetical protein
MLFPRGENGWHPDIPRSGAAAATRSAGVLQRKLAKAQRRGGAAAATAEDEDDENTAAGIVADEAVEDAAAAAEFGPAGAAWGGDPEGGEEEEDGEGVGPPRRIGNHGPRTTVTCIEWGAYHLQLRPDRSKHLLMSGRLLQEYMVDMCCQVENHRLRWYRLNQTHIKADSYQNVTAAVQEGEQHCFLCCNVGCSVAGLAPCCALHVCHAHARLTSTGSVCRPCLKCKLTR